MRPRFAEQIRTGRVIILSVAFTLTCGVPRAEAAEKLKQKTRQAWETYEGLTEKRIFDTELRDLSRFLHLDFMPAKDSRKIREVLKSGKVYVQKMSTLDDKGKELHVDDGLIHHLNSYWRFKQEGDGIIVECESISLSRGIPTMVSLFNIFSLGAIRGVIESLPRESLESTLTSMRDGVRKN